MNVVFSGFIFIRVVDSGRVCGGSAEFTKNFLTVLSVKFSYKVSKCKNEKKDRNCIYDNCTLHTVSETVSLDYQAVTNILEIKAGSSVRKNSGGRRKLRSARLSQSAESLLNGANRAEFENKYRISKRMDIYMLQQRC